MSETLSVCILVASLFVDLWMFFKINTVKLELDIQLLLSLLVMGIDLIVYVNLNIFGSLVASIIEIVGFYLIYKDKIDARLVVGSILFICTIDVFGNIVSEIITFENSNLQKYGSIIVLGSMILFTNKHYLKIKNILTGKDSNILLMIFTYLLVTSELILIIPLLIKSYRSFVIFIGVIYASQVLFGVVAYWTLVRIRKRLLREHEQREEIEKQKQLQEYTDYLEKSQDDLRAFRHDYKNILNSLKVSAQEGNVQEVVQKLDKYTQTTLNSKALLKYKDVNHIYIKLIKSIIISKLTELYNLDIPYNFECRNNIHNLPDHINELDLVRIIGITFDNAIEESKALIGEKHNIRSAEVQIMVYSDGPREFEYEIRNRIQNKKISTSQIQQRGFTTKKNHKGLGLANIKEIENKYPDMSISYTIQDGWFDFYMTIDTEDGEENE